MARLPRRRSVSPTARVRKHRQAANGREDHVLGPQPGTTQGPGTGPTVLLTDKGTGRVNTKSQRWTKDLNPNLADSKTHAINNPRNLQ